MDVAKIALLIPIISVISVFTFLTIIVVMKSNNRRIEREKLYEVARAAVDKGQPLPPEVISSLTQAAPNGRSTSFSDLRSGVICLAVGIGLSLFGLVLGIEDREPFHPLVGIGAIPALVGVALIALSRFNPNKGSRS